MRVASDRLSLVCRCPNWAATRESLRYRRQQKRLRHWSEEIGRQRRCRVSPIQCLSQPETNILF